MCPIQTPKIQILNKLIDFLKRKKKVILGVGERERERETRVGFDGM